MKEIRENGSTKKPETESRKFDMGGDVYTDVS